MWGIVPAAGRGSRIQPLAFSKELLPVGSRLDQAGRAARAPSATIWSSGCSSRGATASASSSRRASRTSWSISAASCGGASICYAVQPQPVGLCDAIFRALPFIAPDETGAIGLPDTIWFPDDGFARLPRDRLSFLLFPVARPEFFDAVVTSDDGRGAGDPGQAPGRRTRTGSGARSRRPARSCSELHALWEARGRGDEYIGTLVNAYLAGGGTALGVRAGELYVDVGTLDGYREAITLLSQPSEQPPSPAWA